MAFPLELQTILLQQDEVSLFAPASSAVRNAYKQGLLPFPYWSQVWPAAMGLAEFLCCYPFYTQQKNVVELGAGLGLPSLIAARNAAQVLCTDYIPEAVAIAEQSAKQSGLKNFSATTIDWNDLPSDLTADVLLLSDINYDPGVFDRLQNIITSFLRQGTMVLISTPQRLMAKNFIGSLLSHCVKQEEITVKEKVGSTAITILVLHKNK